MRGVAERDKRYRAVGPRSFFIVWLSGLVALGVSCRERSQTVDGRLDAAAPPRIVSLAPAMTESLFAIGAGNLVVARTRYCDAPKEALRVPVIGGFADPDVEAILLLRPTLLVGSESPAIESLRRAVPGASFATPALASIKDIEAMLKDLGTRTRHEREASALVAHIESDLGAIDRAFAGVPKKKVLLIFGVGPLVAAGRTGFASDMLRHLATENLVTDDAAYPILDGERLQRLRPDLVLFALGNGQTEVPAQLRAIPAVLAGHVVNVEDPRVLRPGPRVVEGMRVLGKKIHPEIEVPDIHPVLSAE